MTNFISTDQSRSACVESASFSAAICTRDSDCRNRPFMANANGRWTGRCIFSSVNETKNSTGLCEIEGKMNKYKSIFRVVLYHDFRKSNN